MPSHVLRRLLDKWVDATNARIALAVIQVFRVGGLASKFHGGCDDCGVPVGKLVAVLDLECRPEHSFGDCQNRVGFERLKNSHHLIMGKFEFCRGIDVKLT